MAQANRLKFRKSQSVPWVNIKQPDEDMSYNFETTYTSDTTRTQDGGLHLSPMFTVEAFGYKASNVKPSEMHEILQIIATGGVFYVWYNSPYYGTWREGRFYVGKGSLNIGSWKESKEAYSSLTFNFIGVDPV